MPSYEATAPAGYVGRAERVKGAAYRSTDCRIGTHPKCTEAEREKDQPQPVEGVRYETCTCPCHDWRGADQ